MEDILYVFLNNKLEGELTRSENGGLVFEYSKNAKNPLSLSLPIADKIFRDKECRGYFNGLLPENDNVRVRIAHEYNIKNPNNDFEILKAIGHDCPGAISFLSNQSNKYLKEYYDIQGRELSDKELEDYINNLPEKPLGTGAENYRLSLAGAQYKTAIIYVEKQILMPDNMTPASHILKPAIKSLKETVENEYICMKTAEKLGIRVPNVQIKQAGKIKYFLIERYDRIISNNKIKRLHQEDFCQALNIASAFKYEVDGGINFKNCFDILSQTTKPAIDIKEFLNRIIFNYLIMNNDAHGKNFSIIYNEDGTTELAPAYDLICTKVYKKLDYKMAMSIGEYYDVGGIMPVHFEKLAKSVGISYALLKNIIIEYCDLIPAAMEDIINTCDNSIGKEMLDVIKKQCYRNLKNFKA